MVEKVKSWAADSDAVYAGNDNFRIRKTSEGKLRIHVTRNAVRMREDYVAMDLSMEDLVQAAAMVAAKTV
jgi:hypothetical protein